MTTLSNRALLVSVNIRQWNGRRLDKVETEQVLRRNNASKGAARVNKDLLPGAFSLDEVRAYVGEIRTDLYKNTLPWADGVRILRSDGYMAFAAKMAAHRTKFEQLVAKFVACYPQLQVNASHTLGGLYNADDYPHATELAEKFKMEVAYLPVPDADDWRVDLSNEHIGTLRASVEKQVKAAQDAAMRDVFERIYDVARKAHERLSDPKAVFRNSLIENAAELCEVLPSLNLTGDRRVDDLRTALQSALGSKKPAELRKDSKARAKTAAEMQQIMAKMGPMFGAR